MADGIFYPAVYGDDGYNKGTVFNNTYSYLCFGRVGGGLNNAFVRFPSVNIPKNSTITEAYVRFTAYINGSVTICNANCYFEDSDNAVAPVDSTSFNALVLTEAVAWAAVPAWTDGTQYDTPSLVTILQDIIDKAGWASGNAVQIIVEENSSTSSDAIRYASTINYLSGAEKAELHITWTVPTSDINVNLPVISPLLGGGGLLSPTLPAISPFLGGGGLISATPPMITALLEGSDDLAHGNISLPMPMITASLIEANDGALAVSIPIITAEIGVPAGSDLNVTLPMITAAGLAGTGAFLETDLPLITAEMQSGILLDADLPMITASLDGKVGRVGNLAETLPAITVSITGKVEVLGEIDADLPMILPYLSGLTGNLMACAAVLPMITAEISGYNDLKADIDTELPMIIPYMVGTTARFTSCSALRWEEPV